MIARTILGIGAGRFSWRSTSELQAPPAQQGSTERRRQAARAGVENPWPTTTCPPASHTHTHVPEHVPEHVPDVTAANTRGVMVRSETDDDAAQHDNKAGKKKWTPRDGTGRADTGQTI